MGKKKQKTVTFVLDKNKTPLYPTANTWKVDKMLKDGRAQYERGMPFTIRLTHEVKAVMDKKLYLLIDPGRTNIGICVITETGDILFQAHVSTRNKEIPKLMEDRAMHRNASRRGERKRRQRRAVAAGTTFDKNEDTVMVEKGNKEIPARERHLPQYGEGKSITNHYIKNTESKFNNRTRPDGWITPTARQLLDTYLHVIEMVCELMPITDVVIELNRFAFMAMDDPTIWEHPEDFQNGSLKGYKGVREAVYAMQEGKCLLCGKEKIDDDHYMRMKSEGGAWHIDNIVGLCKGCHDKTHIKQDEKAIETLKRKHGERNKKYAALSVLNQVMPYFIEEVKERFPDHVTTVASYRTYEIRKRYSIPKEHQYDAYCAGLAALGLDELDEAPCDPGTVHTYEIQQFRAQDRARINAQRERAYFLGDGHGGEAKGANGKHIMVAKNRNNREEQKGDSLATWYEKMKEEHGEREADRMRSQLIVNKSRRYMNNLGRHMPGTVYRYNGEICILKGQNSGGAHFWSVAEPKKTVQSNKCEIIRENDGLIFLS